MSVLSGLLTLHLSKELLETPYTCIAPTIFPPVSARQKATPQSTSLASSAMDLGQQQSSFLFGAESQDSTATAWLSI